MLPIPTRHKIFFYPPINQSEIGQELTRVLRKTSNRAYFDKTSTYFRAALSMVPAIKLLLRKET